MEGALQWAIATRESLPMTEKKRPRSVGVHDGTFHADEVTACALLVLFDLVDSDKIVRTRDKAVLSHCEYVCDVGGQYDPDLKLFDHHQVGYQGLLSSAGMVLEYLCKRGTIDEEGYHFFDEALVRGVDDHDNGRFAHAVGLCTFSHVVANFVPVRYDVPKAVTEEAFKAAFEFVLGHLERMWERHNYQRECRAVVASCMSQDPLCLIFDESLPWLESFFALDGEHHPALFVIMPSGEHWKLRGIPPSYKDRMSVRVPLPKAWAGLLEDDLVIASGIKGAIFCHKGRFISVWKTKEDALRALKIALEEAKIK